MNTVSRNSFRENLNRLLRPRHIAYIGGSHAAGPLNSSRKAGFSGGLWVVNPVREEIGGLKCYASIEDLPEAPDAALLALSPEGSIEAVKALAAIGAGGAVCMAAGFAELGPSGARLQQELKLAAADMAILGPNCMGLLNLFDGAAIWGSGNHIEHPGEYGAAIISQSGAFLYGITNVEQGFPLGYAISTGNQAVIDMADCIEAVLADNRVRAIGLYMEGLGDGKALGNACWQALEKGIPVIAMKGGDSAEAEAVAISHTSAMVVERDLWVAFAERYGIVEVSSPKALVETLKFLSVGGIPGGNRLSVITHSGGLNSLVVTQAPRLGLQLVQPTEANAKSLRDQMPETVPIANPLDLNLPWSSKTGMSLADGDQIADCLTTLASEVADMAVMILDVPRADESGIDQDWYPSMEAMAQVSDALGIPCAVAGILPEGLAPELRKHLLQLGIAPLLGFDDAMTALSVAARIGQIHRIKLAGDRPGDLIVDGIDSENSSQLKMLDEAESKKRLAVYGLKTPEFSVSEAEQAPDIASDLGFPVALKLLSSRISHKAKVGGVKLALVSKAAVEQAIVEITESVRKSAGEEVKHFLVERMVADARDEFIIGIKRQPALGLALMIGRGGTAPENLNTYATILLPLVEADLKVAMERIGLDSEVSGFDAIFESMLAIGAFALDHANELESLDVNPVIVTENGDAIATDALIVNRHRSEQ
jgi:acyl-CoA synthetase (NDP forming)